MHCANELTTLIGSDMSTVSGRGGQLPALIAGIGLLGLGFMLAHSTLLTIATEVAPKARGWQCHWWPSPLWAAAESALQLEDIRSEREASHCSMEHAPWRWPGVLALIVVRDVRTELERLVSTRAQ